VRCHTPAFILVFSMGGLCASAQSPGPAGSSPQSAATPPTPENVIASARVYRTGRDKFPLATACSGINIYV
jgi:hypothetical protein